MGGGHVGAPAAHPGDGDGVPTDVMSARMQGEDFIVAIVQVVAPDPARAAVRTGEMLFDRT